VTKDSIDGARVLKYLALTYAWTGKKDAALAELEKAARLPGYLCYGDLKLDPVWDPIRDDPRFQKLSRLSRRITSGNFSRVTRSQRSAR